MRRLRMLGVLPQFRNREWGMGDGKPWAMLRWCWLIEFVGLRRSDCWLCGWVGWRPWIRLFVGWKSTGICPEGFISEFETAAGSTTWDTVPLWIFSEIGKLLSRSSSSSSFAEETANHVSTLVIGEIDLSRGTLGWRLCDLPLEDFFEGSLDFSCGFSRGSLMDDWERMEMISRGWSDWMRGGCSSSGWLSSITCFTSLRFLVTRSCSSPVDSMSSKSLRGEGRGLVASALEVLWASGTEREDRELALGEITTFTEALRLIAARLWREGDDLSFSTATGWSGV